MDMRQAMDNRSALLFDVALALGLALLSLSIVVGTVDGGGDRALAIALASAHVLPLVVRRRHSEPVLTVMVVTGLIFAAAGYPTVGLGPAILVSLYTLAARRPPVRSLLLTAGAAGAMLVAVSASGARADTMAGNTVVFGAAWLLGDRQRRAVEQAAAERERAAEMARTRESMARQAVAEERLRIARELHDVVAHAMSVITVQAGTARMVIDESPGVAREALGAIETTSRSALAEMRRLLSVLRDDADGDGAALLSPAKGLADLDALVAATVGSGLTVDMRLEGQRVALPAGADLAAFRIVQEALTNVRRHSRASRASVVVRYLPSEVAVEVVDDGVGGPPGEGGHGLVGMRERAALYGGDVEAGPGPAGGFRVRARIPLGTD
jgi:signal transduction histidine kinase